MSFQYKGQEISSWHFKGGELSSILLHGKEIYSAGNFVTADGKIIRTSDGMTFNAKEIK
jgi:hypothetical protein